MLALMGRHRRSISPCVAVGRLNYFRQQRNGTGVKMGGDQRHHADHGEAPVLELRVALAGELLGREALGEAKRIPQEDLARRATLRVVGLGGGLLKPFQHADDANNLGFASIRHGIPRGVAIAAQALESDALLNGQVSREERTAGRDVGPAGDSSHGDTRVLQLASAVPRKRLLRCDLAQAHRIEHLATCLGAGALHVRHAHLHRCSCPDAGPHTDRRSEGRGGG
mmetsp:Transcript_48397/g.109039  ORF Transcript_48397/g.109039 Transcript_48397/m.109039 type:complete len:225 (-) Transcript_48397:40-714(-)